MLASCYTYSKKKAATNYSLRHAESVLWCQDLPKTNRGSILSVDKIFVLLSPQRPDWIRGPPKLLFNANCSFFTRVKRPDRQPDHKRPSSSEVKKTGAIVLFSQMPSWREERWLYLLIWRGSNLHNLCCRLSKLNKNKLQIQGRIRIFKSGILEHFPTFCCFTFDC